MGSIGTVARGAGQAVSTASKAHMTYSTIKGAIGSPGQGQQSIQNSAVGDEQGLY